MKNGNPLSATLVGFLRVWQIVPGLLPVSRATFWRMVRTGRFPRGVRLSPKVTAWPVDVVAEWLETARLSGVRK